MSRPIELVVTDLDGTLWGPTGECHADTIAALGMLAQRHVPVLIATGRRRRSAGHGLRRNDVELPAVLLNGCHGWDYQSSEQFHLAPFDRGEAHAVVDHAREAGISPVIYVDHDNPDCFAEADCSTAPGHRDALAPFLAATTDLHDVIDQHAVLGFAILGRPLEEMEGLADVLNHHSAGEATTSIDHQYGDASLMIQPAGVSKWAGVEAFCAHHRINPDRVLAIGDAGNDIAMLQAAAVAVAVDGAPASVLAEADHVVGLPQTGGWATVVDLV